MYNDQLNHINKDSMAKQDEFTERKQTFKVEGHCVNTAKINKPNRYTTK